MNDKVAHAGFAGDGTNEPRTDRIRQLNDEFRASLSSGPVMITAGIEALGLKAVTEILSSVRQFCDFTPDNDPQREHDFGCLQWARQTIFWKIDYYDCELTHGSADPANPLVTTRVLTIMLATEY